MLMRSIGSTMLLSAAIASAIAIAQSPDKAKLPSDLQAPQAVLEAQPAKAHSTYPALADQVYSVPQGAAQYYVPQVAFSGQSTGPYGVMPQYYAAQMLSPEEQQKVREFRLTVEQLRRADSPEKKAQARERLSEIVSAQLDRDLQQREEKLAQIEARAQELRTQLEQRRSSKAEIQKTLMMMIENPETGLGLPPAWMSSLMQPGPSTTPMYSLPVGSTLPLPATLPPGSSIRPTIAPQSPNSSLTSPVYPASAPSDSNNPSK